VSSENANLYAIFRQHYPADMGTILLTTGTGQQFSYQDADNQSAAFAGALLAQGLKPGDRVTVQVEKSVEMLWLYLGCLRAGLVFHPLNTAYSPAELDYFLGNAEPGLVVCTPDSLALMTEISAQTCHARVLTLGTAADGSLMEAVANATPWQDCVQSSSYDVAALLYSSGTTGRPKGIMLTHHNLASNALTLVDAWGFSDKDVLLHALPIFHVHGLFVAISCVLMSGASMRWLASFNVDAVLKEIPNSTVMMGVPTYYTRLLDSGKLTAELCGDMRLFISGSAPLLIETFNAFKTATGHTILERYGMSETGMNLSNPLQGERRAGTVGFPLPEVSARIVDDNGNIVNPGKVGNLQVKGPNVFKGYWRMPEKTAADFTSDGFFDTGDKASLSADGYYSIVGRAKDMVICGGLNVYPKEVELVIDTFPGVLESAVIGVPHPDFGEAVVAVVVPESNNSPIDEQALIDYCRQQLANFKLPKQVKVVDALPRNTMGKVQKNLLRDRYNSLFSQ
jgi:malonyl-CoA/methylmalonyl-CoA synthetase